MKFNLKKIYIIFLVLIFLILLFVIGPILPNKTKELSPQNPNLLVFYQTGKEIDEIKSINEKKASQIPDNLMIKPGYYQVNDRVFDFNKEGLYRILLWPNENIQRIVYSRDTLTLLSSLAWIDSHGSRDDNLKLKDLEEKAKKEKIITTCGPISKLAQYILDKENISSRLVSGITQDNLNGFDDSHTMIEVKIDSAWQVFDLDNNLLFRQNGQNLNFVKLVEIIRRGDAFELIALASDTNLAIANFKDSENNYDYSFYGEAKFSTEDNLKEWYKRVLGVALIKSDNHYYYSMENPKNSDLLKTAINLGPQEFKQKFY